MPCLLSVRGLSALQCHRKIKHPPGMLAAIAIYPAERDAFYRFVTGVSILWPLFMHFTQGVQESCIPLRRCDIRHVLHGTRDTYAIRGGYGSFKSCYSFPCVNNPASLQLYAVVTMAGMGLQIDARRFFEFSFGVFALINFGESIGVCQHPC